MKAINKGVKIFFKTFLIIMLIALAVGLGFFLYCVMRINYFKSTTVLDKEKLLAVYNYPVFYDVNNIELPNIIKTKTPVEIKDLPPYVTQAFVSIEDKNFYKHNGINPLRIIKAGSENIISGKAKQGASTISQQLVKNVFLTNEKTLDRKLKEYALTKKLENSFTKNDILELYLNSIYFGRGNIGIENASQNYFNKSTKDLTVAESATLAGMINSPSFYAKSDNINMLNTRKNRVINEMFKDGIIDESLKNEQKAVNIELLKSKTANSSLQNALSDQVCKILRISENDFKTRKLKVFTSIDYEKQKNLQNIIDTSSKLNQKLNYGSIILDNKTGLVEAFYSSNNDFINIKRQAGSSIKPLLVYAPAIDLGIINPLTPILDEPINYNGYCPTNSSKGFSGYINPQEAISKSLNIPAVKVLDYVGIDNAKDYAKKMGLNFAKTDNNLSLALGSSLAGESLLNLTSAYQTLANEGKNIKASFIRKIVDKNDICLYKNNYNELTVFGSDTAFLMTNMLKQTAKTGTAKKLADLEYDIASKTGTVGCGTTSKNTDAYNFSYTSKNVVSVYVGSSNNREENLMPQNINGATIPTTIVKEILGSIYHNAPPPPFVVDKNVKKINIDLIDLKEKHQVLKASSLTPNQYIISEYFSNRYIPYGTSENFLKLKRPELKVEIKNELFAEITFDVKGYLYYEIYKNDVLLKTISNKSGKHTEIDGEIVNGNTYNYYIISKLKNENTNISEKSNSVDIVFNKTSFDTKNVDNNQNNDKTAIESEKEPPKLSNDPLYDIKDIFRNLFSD